MVGLTMQTHYHTIAKDDYDNMVSSYNRVRNITGIKDWSQIMKKTITLEAADPIEIFGAGNKIFEEFCS